MNENELTLKEKIQLNAGLITEHLSQHADFELGNDPESSRMTRRFYRAAARPELILIPMRTLRSATRSAVFSGKLFAKTSAGDGIKPNTA